MSGPSFVAAPLTIQDVHAPSHARTEEVLALRSAAIEQLGPAGYAAEEVAAWRDSVVANASELDAHWSMLTARLDGRLVGFAQFHEGGYLGSLFVHPSFARRGIGSALLSKYEDALLARGVQEFVLDASLSAVGFYLKQDYCAFERIDYLSRQRTILPAVRMRKYAD